MTEAETEVQAVERMKVYQQLGLIEPGEIRPYEPPPPLTLRGKLYLYSERNTTLH